MPCNGSRGDSGRDMAGLQHQKHLLNLVPVLDHVHEHHTSVSSHLFWNLQQVGAHCGPSKPVSLGQRSRLQHRDPHLEFHWGRERESRDEWLEERGTCPSVLYPAVTRRIASIHLLHHKKGIHTLVVPAGCVHQELRLAVEVLGLRLAQSCSGHLHLHFAVQMCVYCCWFQVYVFKNLTPSVLLRKHTQLHYGIGKILHVRVPSCPSSEPQHSPSPYSLLVHSCPPQLSFHWHRDPELQRPESCAWRWETSAGPSAVFTLQFCTR